MQSYVLTVFSPSGEKLLDEPFIALDDNEAKQTAASRLIETNYSEHTHRCVTADGKLIVFHR